MAWYNPWEKKVEVEEKLNPAQFQTAQNVASSKEPTFSYQQSYERIEIVNRCVNMIVDDASEIPLRVMDQIPNITPVNRKQGIKKSRIAALLNHQPNPYQDISSFKRNLIIDLLIDGNIFIYFDGAHLFHLPAEKVSIIPDPVTWVKEYKYEKVTFKPHEIIHIKENSFDSIYRGVPRLKPALRTMRLMTSMRDFQDNFFKNGAVVGLVIKTPNTISDKIKQRMLIDWQQTYNPKCGGERPIILDGGMEMGNINTVNFRELDFQNSISENEKIIMKAMGVPPILLDSGNNANIRPNLRLYYLETIIPIVRKITYSFEHFFGFELTEDVSNIPALQPEIRDQAQYITSMVNTGVFTPNEAREQLGMEPDPDPESDKLRIPANIAGSAVDATEGGRPDEGKNDNVK
jgi:HK97 family phage portal protein